MKKLLIGLAVVAVGSGAWWFLTQRNAPAPVVSPSLPDMATVERRTIDVVVDAIGEVNPANQVTIKPEVSGRIRSVEVKPGETVKSGGLLVSLDDTDLLTEKRAAETEIAGAKLQLEKAQRDYDRHRDLFREKLVSQEAFDNAKTTLDLARNDFERAQRRLQLVEDKLKKVSIGAPFDGTVLNVFVSDGQVVSGATGVSQGTDLMTFADLNEMIIRSHVNQVDAAKIQPDQHVGITVDALPGVALEGTVTLIAPQATVKNNVKGFAVDVLIARIDPRLRPGMNANLKFPVARAEAVLTVPIVAVFLEGAEKVVYVGSATGEERRVVTTGVSDYNRCEIRSGLNEGETVLLERPASAPQPKS